MKKSLLALAALAAAGAASAQSSVTLYGIADISGGYKEVNVDGAKTKTTGANVGNLSGSRIGFKGAEDLGNGLKAVFNYEFGIDSAHGNWTDSKNLNNEGSSSTSTREAFVGLEGNFGQVRVGTTDTPVRNLAIAGTADGYSDFDTTTLRAVQRASGVHYFGNFSGVGIQAFAGYHKDESLGTTTNNYKGYGLGLSYANGPLLVGLAAQQFKQSEAPTSKKTEAVVGGTYDFGTAKVFANYVYGKVGVDGNFNTAYAGVFDKVQELNLGVTVPYGAASFVAEYGRNRYNLAGTNEKFSGNDFMIGANYAFSKRTDVYVRAAQQEDLKDGDVKLWTRTYAAGIRHKF
ncbi:porin [Brachymonas sp.]|uniref:porin n=1 Tax=Brachymonas sp. TaxID=1936292 RepID=UPI0035B2334A